MSQEIAEFAYDLHAGLSSLQVGSERTQDSTIDDDMIRRDDMPANFDVSRRAAQLVHRHGIHSAGLRLAFPRGAAPAAISRWTEALTPNAGSPGACRGR